MLIDASHPEETRVAVVRGNRIEEFDFESQEKKQLRGNIYLAKVTRVEPSLQAAFVDYGGNRHGFLAFSEIHPDYYQIPMADRQALLEAEAEEARAMRDAEEAEDSDENGDEEDEARASEEEEAEAPKKKPRRRRSRKKADDSSDGDTEKSQEAASDEDKNTGKTDEEEASAQPEKNDADAASDDQSEEKAAKPKRRTSRRKTPAKKKAEDTEAGDSKPEDAPAEQQAASDPAPDTGTDNADDNGDDDGDDPKTMAAIVETDSVSEDLPENDTDTGEEESGEAASEQPEEKKEKKPRTRRAPARRKKAAQKDEAAGSEDGTSENGEAGSDAPEDAEAKKPESTDDDSADDSGKDGDNEENGEEETGKSRRRGSRRRSSRSRRKSSDNNGDDGDDDDNGKGNSEVEQVGQEDALEEVPNPRRQRRHYKIQEVIKRRQVLLVQVVKEERGNKGAALTTYLSLAGRYSVLMPNTARGGGISRKITNAADRKRLKGIASKLDVPNGMGVILRTAGASRTEAEINRDFEYLMRLWEQVRNLTLSSSAPCLVYEEGSLIKRSIRDLYDKDTGEILVSGENGFAEAKEFMAMLMPEHVKKVKPHKDNQAIFAKYGVESQLDRMVSPQVTLKSGGYLVINQTEALVAVDVNSGRSTREHSIEDTALQTNLEAAEEVARQLRLRDLAGLIVIDFIDMEEKRNNRAVEKRLKDCLKSDRARIQVGRISHFGLMEMSRQRMRASVLESTMEVCEHCAGLGYIRSDSAIALHVFRAIEEHVAKHNRYDAVVKTTRAIAFHILNHKRAALLELEMKHGLRVLIQGDGSINGQEFSIEKGEPARGETGAAPVGYQNEAAFDAMEASQDDSDDKQKSGNRRSRKRQDDDDSGSAQDAAQGNDDSGEESDDDRSSRKRRRGKRGGRKRKNNERNENASEDENPEVDNKDHGDESTDPDVDPKPKRRRARKSDKPEPADDENAASADNNQSGQDDDEAASKSRTTRRNRVTQKAPVQEKTASDETEKKSEPAAEPPRPARRRTSRRDAGSAQAPDENAESNSAAGKLVAEARPPETDVDNVDPAKGSADNKEADKPRKSGWWSRGGGFF